MTPKIISPLEGMGPLPDKLKLWSKNQSLAQKFLGINWDIFGSHQARKRIITLSPHPFAEQQKGDVLSVFGWQTKPGFRFLGRLPVSYVRGDMRPNVLLCLSFTDKSAIFLQRLPNNSSNFIMTPGIVFESPDAESLTSEDINFVMSIMNDRTISGPTMVITREREQDKNKAIALARTFGDHETPFKTFANFEQHDDALLKTFTLCTHAAARRLYDHGAKTVTFTLNGRLYTVDGKRTAFDVQILSKDMPKENVKDVKDRILSVGNNMSQYLTKISEAHSKCGMEGVCFNHSHEPSAWLKNNYLPHQNGDEYTFQDAPNDSMHQNYTLTPWSRHQMLANAKDLSLLIDPELAQNIMAL